MSATAAQEYGVVDQVLPPNEARSANGGGDGAAAAGVDQALPPNEAKS